MSKSTVEEFLKVSQKYFQKVAKNSVQKSGA